MNAPSKTVRIPFGRGRVARVERILLALFAIHLVLKIALFPRLANAPIIGDESQYVDGARALSNLVRDLVGFGPIDVTELQRSVVASGWFMPGMSVLMTPLFIVDPNASVTVIRAYLGVLTTVLLICAVMSVRRVLGDLYAGLLLVFPGLVPMWLLFSYTAWGDLCAGLLLVVLLMQVIALVRCLRTGVSPSARECVRLALVAVAVLYVRSSTSLLIGGLLVVAGLAALWLLRGRQRWRAVVQLALAAAVFVLCLLPWSLFASQTLGGRVVTTTSVPDVLGNTFGARDELCFGPCDPGSTLWFSPLRYSREVARATGLSEVDVQKQMSSYALRNVTAHSYARDVVEDFGRYVGEPARFSKFLRPPGASTGDTVEWLVRKVTDVMFGAMLLAGALLLLSVFRRPFDHQLTSVVLKLSLGALLVQPFVHIAGSRYWTTAAPVAALGIGLLVAALADRRAGRSAVEAAVEGQRVSDLALRGVFTGIQMLLAVGSVLVAVVVAVLAR